MNILIGLRVLGEPGSYSDIIMLSHYSSVKTGVVGYCLDLCACCPLLARAPILPTLHLFIAKP